MKINKYEYAENIINTQILKQDRLTFSVLKAVVNAKSRLVITDHERFIICHSCHPYPVWVWTVDDISETELENIWQMIKSEFPLEEGYEFHTKYLTAEYFIKRSKAEKILFHITLNMYVYDCNSLIAPKKRAEGKSKLCTIEDKGDIAQFLWSFKEETGIEGISEEECREKADILIENKTLYLWKNIKEENVAMCSYSTDEELGKLMHVYTKKEERRKGYAENLVYEVTKIVKEKGKLPVLYTDADYPASNECYKKIGYKLKGKLCNISKLER